MPADKKPSKPAKAKAKTADAPLTQAELTRRALEQIKAKGQGQKAPHGGPAGKGRSRPSDGGGSHTGLKGSTPPRRTQGKGG